MAISSNFNRRLFINIGIVAAVLIVFVVSVIFFSLEISKNSSFIFDTRSEIARRSGAISEVTRLKKTMTEVEPLFLALESMIPSRDSVIVFSEYAKGLANNNDLTFIFRFGEESPLNDLYTSSFNVTVAGDYNGVTNFIKEIEKAPYFINFVEISIVRQLEKYSANLNGKLVFRGQNNVE